MSPRHRVLRELFVAAGLMAAACGSGGSGSAGAAGPTAPTPTASGSVEAVARQIGSLTLTGLRGVSGEAAPAAAGLAAQMPFAAPLAFTGSYQVSCPVSGWVSMQRFRVNLPFIGHVDLSEVVEVFEGCAFDAEGVRHRLGGQLHLGGTYPKNERPPFDVRLIGRLDVVDPLGPQQVDGQVDATGGFTGVIGGRNVNTGPTLAPLPAVAPAELLAGRWHGRAIVRESSTGCVFTSNLAISLGGSGDSITGSGTATIVQGTGPIGECGDAEGLVIPGSISGTAKDGELSLSAFGGAVLAGQYSASGNWMGGRWSGGGLVGDWQAVR